VVADIIRRSHGDVPSIGDLLRALRDERDRTSAAQNQPPDEAGHRATALRGALDPHPPRTSSTARRWGRAP
jgi:hypothetical protein